ncbi:MAG: type III polyketide synthase [Geodermatophilaceae bacterium]|nr:type III polyketide synthase [Geodermatophilaceae bacterium]
MTPPTTHLRTQSRIVSVAVALPEHRYDQAAITTMVSDLVLAPGASPALLRRLHGNAGVEQRHLVLPLAAYAGLDGFGAANDVFIRAGLDLGARAITDALNSAGLSAQEVDLIVATSVTGVAAPSLDALLVTRLGLRSDVKRIPIFGLGCVAGAAGVARVHDYLLGHPDDVAVLLSVELCSLTVQRDDPSTANLVASGLFGDGAAAVVMTGAGRAAALRPGPDVVATRSRFYPGTERVMGWDIGGTGFRIVLDASVADVVGEHLADDMKAFLAASDLDIPDITRWVAHPGGPKVLTAVQQALALPDEALRHAWISLASVGNLSSASVLHVLASTLDEPAPEAGSFGVLMAMGPGFCAELVLLHWSQD